MKLREEASAHGGCRASGKKIYYLNFRSQWPHGLKHELSSLTRTLKSRVRILVKAWMFVYVYSVFVLFRV
jgi:hypothetical protein